MGSRGDAGNEEAQEMSGYVQEPHLTEFMSQDMRSKCGSCRWFAEHEGPTWDEAKQETTSILNEIFFDRPHSIIGGIEWKGTCRRYPPTVTPIEDDLSTDWPQVDWNDWCGEYRTETP